MVWYDCLRWNNIKETAVCAAVTISLCGILLSYGNWRNHSSNNQIINAPSHKTVSYVHGGFGHTEYTVFKKDGSQEVKIFPKSGCTLGDSELDQDVDGDGLVDRLRINKGGFGYYRLVGLYSRDDKDDYSNPKIRPLFDAADSRLQDLMRKYPRQP